MSIHRKIITSLGATLCLTPLLALASGSAPVAEPQATVQEQPLLLAFGGGTGRPSGAGRDYRRDRPDYSRGSMGRGPSGGAMGPGGPSYGAGPAESYGPGSTGRGPGGGGMGPGGPTPGAGPGESGYGPGPMGWGSGGPGSTPGSMGWGPGGPGFTPGSMGWGPGGPRMGPGYGPGYEGQGGYPPPPQQ